MDDFSNVTTIEDKTDFIISLVVICLFGGLLWFLIPGQTDNYNSTNDIVEVNSVKLIEPHTIEQLNQKITKSDELKSWVDSLAKESVKSTPYLPMVEVSLIETNNISSHSSYLNAVVTEYSEDSILQNTEIIQNEEQLFEEKRLTEDVAITAIDTSSELNNLSLDNNTINYNNDKEPTDDSVNIDASGLSPVIDNKYLEDQTNCVVILGAFQNNNNFMSYLEIIKSKHSNQNVYTGVRNNYNVIGIHVPCDDANSSLIKYKEKYNMNAWLLKLEER